ncbi:MAG: hypothetical protein PVI57_04485 [Gemmatimonadota bacterium]|jgi:hypothetical protein
MKTVEIIHLRFAGQSPAELVETISAAARDRTDVAAVRIFRHAWIETDLLLHLEREGAEDRPSPLGIHLAAILRGYGMVDHSVWVDRSGRSATVGGPAS